MEVLSERSPRYEIHAAQHTRHGVHRGFSWKWYPCMQPTRQVRFTVAIPTRRSVGSDLCSWHKLRDAGLSQSFSSIMPRHLEDSPDSLRTEKHVLVMSSLCVDNHRQPVARPR